jgi:hypothetical protein
LWPFAMASSRSPLLSLILANKASRSVTLALKTALDWALPLVNSMSFKDRWRSFFCSRRKFNSASGIWSIFGPSFWAARMWCCSLASSRSLICSSKVCLACLTASRDVLVSWVQIRGC